MTAMGKWEFYDEFDELENDEQEPSFSLYDFKKWLECQNHPELTLRESVQEKKKEETAQDKEALKERFKQQMRDKVNKSVERKLAERKKKR
jgi:hypothetical protein